MISKNNILKLKTRQDIYENISEYPGVHLSELSRRLNIPNVSLLYHINTLNKFGLIDTKMDLKYKRYYVKQSWKKSVFESQY